MAEQEILGLQQLKNNFREFSANITTKLDKAVNQGALIVERLAKVNITKNRSVATGLLRASITHRLTKKTDEVYAEVGSNIEYARDVEFGTSPHQVPAADIKKWCKRKGIPTYMADYVVLKISMYGTEPKPFLGPAYRDSVAEIMEMIKEASTRAVKDGNK
jgi:HK97 gp10 family phage protein